MSALRVSRPGQPVELVDLGPLAAHHPPGSWFVPARPVFGVSGDGAHRKRDWAAIHLAQKERRETQT